MRKPHNNDAIKTDPSDTADQGNRVVVRITLAKWIWNCDVLKMSKRHHENVPNDILDALWTLGGIAVFVDGFIYELIDDTLWNCLWLTHHLFLQEDVLPVLFDVLFLVAVVAELVVVTDVLTLSIGCQCGYFCI
jgi:hypothetical protein